MDKIARATEKEREALFRNTATKIGMNAAIVEKDFWVCYVLDYLFHSCKYKKNFVFKGGTSLSKAYHLIKRFSEDIDLILDWRLLGYQTNEPWEERSHTKQDIFNKNANIQAEIMLPIVSAERTFWEKVTILHREAREGKLKLVPPKEMWEELKADYIHMQNMMFGESPDFETLMGHIEILEKEIQELDWR